MLRGIAQRLAARISPPLPGFSEILLSEQDTQPEYAVIRLIVYQRVVFFNKGGYALCADPMPFFTKYRHAAFIKQNFAKVRVGAFENKMRFAHTDQFNGFFGSFGHPAGARF